MPRALLAAIALAALLPAAAHADCCSIYDPDPGSLIAAPGDGAFASFADTSGDDGNGGTTVTGHLTAVDGSGAASALTIPDPGATSAPVVSVNGPDTFTAWQGGGALHVARIGAGVLATPITAAMTTAASPQLAATGDGGAVLAYVIDGAVMAVRIAADGIASTPVMVATGARTGSLRVTSDFSGITTLVWQDASALRAVQVAKGAAPVASAGDVLVSGTPKVFGIAGDNGGGVKAVFASGRDIKLASYENGAHTATVQRLTHLPRTILPSAAITIGTVAYLAAGKSGHADVFVRRLLPGAGRLGNAYNTTRTVAAESRVDAVADNQDAYGAVLFERRVAGRKDTDVFVGRTDAVLSIDLSRTPKRDDVGVGLDVTYGARIVATYLSGDDENGHQLVLRTLYQGAPSAAKVLATADVSTST